MLNYKRADRVGDQIRAEIADILARKIKDPQIGFVTVTAVEVTDDLRHAKVFVSMLESESLASPGRARGVGASEDTSPSVAARAPIYKDSPQQSKTLRGLVRASGFIRTELGKRLRLKFLPQLSFHIDQSARKTAHILQLLEEIKQTDDSHQ